MEIIPGVYQLRFPLPLIPLEDFFLGQTLGQSNVYLIEGNAGWLLVDTGGWEASKVIDPFKKGLKTIGITFKDISEIVVTHVHVDHFGLSGKLKELSGANLCLHRMERCFIEPGDITREQVVKKMRQWLYKNGSPENEGLIVQKAPQGPMKFITPMFPDALFFSGEIGFPDIFFSGGERISTGLFNFEVIWTPGHSPGHICLYERAKKVLISGDHILSHITPVIAFNPFSRSNPLGDYIGSLNSLKRLDVELVLPGHGDCFVHFHRRIDELIQHHEERKKIILELLKDGPKIAYEIASEITWMPEKGGVSWDKLDPWSHRLALMETLAHLKDLEEEGKVKKINKANLDFYCSTE
jgi:glyoxylase-like metal-dependent hydrolase (beta-lactamase superfamily II)